MLFSHQLKRNQEAMNHRILTFIIGLKTFFYLLQYHKTAMQAIFASKEKIFDIVSTKTKRQITAMMLFATAILNSSMAAKFLEKDGQVLKNEKMYIQNERPICNEDKSVHAAEAKIKEIVRSDTDIENRTNLKKAILNKIPIK